MGRKGLVSIFSRLAVDSAPSSSPAAGPATPPWLWPPCGTNPRTASFRAGGGGGEPCCARTTAAGVSRGGPAATGNNKLMVRGAAPGEMYKTVNSVYLDDPAADVDLFSLAGDDDDEEGELLDDVDSFSTTTASEEWSEAVIRSLGRTSTDRFFFDPGPLPASNSILATSAPSPSRKAPPAAEAKTKTVTPPDSGPDDDAKAQQPCAPSKSLAEGSVAVAVDTGDPYGDFRASMEEMVSAHGLRDWAALEELLAWYLRINGKQHHHLIVDAFVDLLLGLASSDTAAETSTSSSSSGSASAGSRCTTSTSTSTAATTSAATVAATTVTTAAAAAAQCGGGKEAAACCSSSSSSCAAGLDIQDDVEEGEEEKASSAAAAGADRARASGGAAASAPLRVPQSIA
ncbi:transcription repressor OFP13-like [Panicum miliaceum]|uniref:Transcription repressor n=1 Tax=Panicum miliaceum TaxID=4540 RepID=A0A3L6T0F2_PANMI|nr:transcription repressor OFP13-like [Panicum miliaceum]